METEKVKLKEDIITEKTAKMLEVVGFDRFKEQEAIAVPVDAETSAEWWPHVSKELVHAWLRREHGLYVHHYSLYPRTIEGLTKSVMWGFDVYDTTQGRNPDNAKYTLFSCLNPDENGAVLALDSYEEAYEAGIRKALEVVIYERFGNDAYKQVLANLFPEEENKGRKDANTKS